MSTTYVFLVRHPSYKSEISVHGILEEVEAGHYPVLCVPNHEIVDNSHVGPRAHVDFKALGGCVVEPHDQLMGI